MGMYEVVCPVCKDSQVVELSGPIEEQQKRCETLNAQPCSFCWLKEKAAEANELASLQLQGSEEQVQHAQAIRINALRVIGELIAFLSKNSSFTLARDEIVQACKTLLEAREIMTLEPSAERWIEASQASLDYYQIACPKCGHIEMKELTVTNEDLQGALESLSNELCSSCWLKDQEAEADKKMAEMDIALPVLQGSEKQVQWAKNIRLKSIEKIGKALKTFIENLEEAVARGAMTEEQRQAKETRVREVCATVEVLDDAGEWIESRHNPVGWFFGSLTVLEQEEAAAKVKHKYKLTLIQRYKSDQTEGIYAKSAGGKFCAILLQNIDKQTKQLIEMSEPFPFRLSQSEMWDNLDDLKKDVEERTG